MLLHALIGRKLTAYIASIKDARAIDRWLHEQVRPQRDVEARLRLAYHIAAMLSEFDTPAVIQAWLLGLNPELDDAVPISLLRDGDMEIDGKKVLNAARAFVPEVEVPAPVGSWLAARKIGSALPAGKRYAHIYSSEWLSHLRKELEPELVRSETIGAKGLSLIWRC